VEEHQLAGGFGSGGLVVRVGETLRRPWRTTAPFEIAVLTHLHEVEPGVAPRYLGRDEQGRQVLSWMAGDVAVPPFPAWATTEAYLTSIARLLRRIHDALEGWSPPDLPWPEELKDPERGTTIVHADVCPENVVCRDGEAVAVIDWEFAAPGRRVWDLVSTARLCVPFTAPSRRDPAYQGLDVTARFGTFLTAYGADGEQRAALREVLHQRSRVGERFVLGRAERGERAFAEKWATEQGAKLLSDERAFVAQAPLPTR
jgi:phosphotransferase family enzyme